jgi:hypothetical protein
MQGLPELPPKFQASFERLKAQAEQEYIRTRTFAGFQDSQEGAADLVPLLRTVWGGYSALARAVCRAGDWSVNTAREATDAALPAIINYNFDLYFRRDRNLSGEEEQRHWGWMRAMVVAGPEWKRNLAEFSELAEAEPPHTETAKEPPPGPVTGTAGQGPPESDPFASREQRENAIRHAAAELGDNKAVAALCGVKYTDLRKWARLRQLAKGESLKTRRIEETLREYVSTT